MAFEGTHIPILALASTPMVAQVQHWQFVAALRNRDGGQVDSDDLWAWHPLESTLADARGRREGSKEGLLVARFRALDKFGPVGFAESLARAALEQNAGLGLFEEGTPASAVAAELLHCKANWARCLGAATAEAQQWQILFVLHECQMAILGAVLMCACLAVLHRTFECAKPAAKLGCANMGCVRGALSSPRAIGWQRVLLLWLLLSVPTTDAATLPLEGPDAGRVASEPNTYVTRGTFDKPLDFLGTEGQHDKPCCHQGIHCCMRSGCHCACCCDCDAFLGGNSSSMEQQSSNSSDPSPPTGPL